MTDLKLFIIFFVVGKFAVNVMTAYNPMLTYSVRFQKFAYTPNITGNLTLNRYKENEFVNGHIGIKSKDPLTKVVAIFHRCNPEGINCEYFQSWALTNVCFLIREKNQVWSSWYGSFHPTAACPIATNQYQVINGTIDIGPAIKWYPDCLNYYWKVTQKLYAGEQLMGSYTFEVSVFSYRKKSKKH